VGGKVKRSQAIEAISKRLGPLGISEPTCVEVLDILEKLGMRPPEYEIWVTPYKNDLPGVTRLGYTDYGQGWEEET
jgi:hypothetical protein